jgi:hypothetical protein
MWHLQGRDFTGDMTPAVKLPLSRVPSRNVAKQGQPIHSAFGSQQTLQACQIHNNDRYPNKEDQVSAGIRAQSSGLGHTLFIVVATPLHG